MDKQLLVSPHQNEFLKHQKKKLKKIKKHKKIKKYRIKLIIQHDLLDRRNSINFEKKSIITFYKK